MILRSLMASRSQRVGESSTLSNPSRDLREVFGTPPETAAGLEVTPHSAMSLPAYYAGVAKLASSLAALPFHLYQRTPKGREKAIRHTVYEPLAEAPNPIMSSQVWRETTLAHAVSWGNGESEIEITNDGHLRLWPLRPDRISFHRIQEGTRKGERVVQVQEGAGRGPVGTRGGQLFQGQLFSIPAFGFDGLRGYSKVALFMETLALGLAAERFGAKLFGSGSMLRGVITHPDDLGPNAIRNIEASVEEDAGLEGAHRVRVLDQGMQYVPIGIPPEEAQFIQTRELNVLDICRLLDLPPHKLKDYSRAHFDNVEHAELDFVSGSLMPWDRRFRNEVRRSVLLNPRERRRYYAEHDFRALLRGDFKTRMEGYALGRMWGWYSPNDIAKRENDPEISADQGGDDYLQPTTHQVAGDPSLEETLERAFTPVLALEAGKALRAQRTELERLARVAPDLDAGELTIAVRALTESTGGSLAKFSKTPFRALADASRRPAENHEEHCAEAAAQVLASLAVSLKSAAPDERTEAVQAWSAQLDEHSQALTQHLLEGSRTYEP